MRILFLTHGYPPYALGGLTLQCHEVAEVLRERGHSIHVLTSRYGVGEGALQEDCVTRALHFQAPMNYYSVAAFFATRRRKERGNLAILRETIDSFEPDIVFIWGLWNLSRALPYWAERRMGPQRVAYAIADYWLVEPDIHQTYWQLPARRLVIEAAKAVIRPRVLHMLAQERQTQTLEIRHATCCSEYTANKLATAGALPHGVRVIYNGIDPQPFVNRARTKPNGAVRKLLYFGGLADHKGVHTAVEALGLLKQRGLAQGLELALVGHGHPDYVSHLRELAARQGVSDQLHFTGGVPRDEIPALLAQHDVYLFTSVWEEPFGRTIVEAMAAGVAVIGSMVGGSQEIMRHGENALTYPAGDASALADRIVQLRESPELIERLCQAGLQTVLDRFTLNRRVSEIEEWLLEIVSGGDT